jgi:hypothetical protein
MMRAWRRWAAPNRRETMPIEFAMLIACVGVLISVVALAMFLD